VEGIWIVFALAENAATHARIISLFIFFSPLCLQICGDVAWTDNAIRLQNAADGVMPASN
jgi:hypothetical protein